MKQFLKDNNGLLQAFNPRIPVYQSYTWVSGVSPAGEVYIIEGDGLYFEKIKLISSGGVPPTIGEIKYYYGTTAPNSDWLICDGSTFDATVYPQLATLLGGNTLPDYRQCVLRYKNIGDSDTTKAIEGTHSHTFISNAHTHSRSISNHTHSGRMYNDWGSYLPDFSMSGVQPYVVLINGQVASVNMVTHSQSVSALDSTVGFSINNNAVDASSTQLEDITRANQIGVNILIRGK